MREEERREAAWFRISPRVLSEAVTSLKYSVPFVSIFYIIEFSKSTCTFKRLSKYWLSSGMFSTPGTCTPCTGCFALRKPPAFFRL